MVGDHTHMFYNCPKIQIFWRNIKEELEKIWEMALPLDPLFFLLEVFPDHLFTTCQSPATYDDSLLTYVAAVCHVKTVCHCCSIGRCSFLLARILYSLSASYCQNKDIPLRINNSGLLSAFLSWCCCAHLLI